MSPFQAVTTAIAGQVGTGNIAGVATAIAAGGPGAIFWMWVSAFLGMATIFCEAVLAQVYRKEAEDGTYVGGPVYYIKAAFKGTFGKVLAAIFAILITLALGLCGNAVQANSISDAFHTAFFSNFNAGFELMGQHVTWDRLLCGILIAALAWIIFAGGVKRIGSVTEKLVPIMAIFYLIGGLIIVLVNIKEVPYVFVMIFKGAFTPEGIAGGIFGISVKEAVKLGIARGLFNNEAGLGSAPIAAAAAKTKDTVRQGLVSMTGTFIDTIVICTMTGLAIVIAGSWANPDLKGVAITTDAFQSGLPFPSVVSSFVLMICLAFFAFTTILGWDYYSERCLEYLSNRNKTVVKVYRWIYVLAVFIGPYLTVAAVWTIADIFNGLMAIPNVIALIALSGVVAKETRDYFKEFDRLSK